MGSSPPDDRLEAAMALFWSRGYAATSIRHLVASTGLTRDALYLGHQSKRGLYRDALSLYRHTVFSRSLRPLAAWARGAASVRRCLTEVRASLEQDREGAGCFLVRAAVELDRRESAAGMIVELAFGQLENAFHRALAHAVERGQLDRDIDARQWARHLTAVIIGATVLHRIAPEGSAGLHALDEAIAELDRRVDSPGEHDGGSSAGYAF